MDQPTLRVDDLPIGTPLPSILSAKTVLSSFEPAIRCRRPDVAKILERGLFSDHSLASRPFNLDPCWSLTIQKQRIRSRARSPKRPP